MRSCLSAFQLNADGVDGNLARVQKQAGFYGDALDNMVLIILQLVSLLIAYMTNCHSCCSSFTIYIVVIFRQHVGIELQIIMFYF